MSTSNVVIINSKKNKNGKSSKNSYDDVLSEILIAKNAKYLGVTFDESFSFERCSGDLLIRLFQDSNQVSFIRTFT